MEPTVAPDYQTEQRQPLPEGAMAFDYAGHLYFDVTLRDSIPARMIFDTGNTNILIETQFFKEHFAPSSTLQRSLIQGAGNSLEAVYRDTSDWTYSVGEYKQTDHGAIVMDLRKILGYQVDGMFGMEFMRGRKVEFNYADEYMRIIAPDAPIPEGYTCIQCRWMDNSQTRMLVPMSVTLKDGLSFEGEFLVDMGAGGGVALTSSTAARLNLRNALTDIKKKIYDTGGVGGSRTDYIFRTNKISVGGHTLTDIEATYSGNIVGAMADERYDGLIGNALLERFDLIFDFAKCEIWLRPNKNFGVAKRFDSGMTLTPQTDGWIVNGLIEGGNAAKAGIRRGDKIIAINGLTPDKLNIRRLKRMDSTSEDWVLNLQRGNTSEKITVKKEKY